SVLLARADEPLAVLLDPVVFAPSALLPRAALLKPVVTNVPAFTPKNVLPKPLKQQVWRTGTPAIVRTPTAGDVVCGRSSEPAPLTLTLPTTSSVALGIAVPIPTLIPFAPRTNELLEETSAFAPIAVALSIPVDTPGPEPYPMKVLFEPVVFT